MSDEINVISRTQSIIVEPVSGSVSIINEGPMGPTGPTGPQGIQGVKGDPGVGGAVAPWGIIAALRSITPSALITTTATDVLVLPWNATTGRQYRISIKVPVQSSVAGDEINVVISDGSNNQQAVMRVVAVTGGMQYAAQIWALITFATGARQAKARIWRVSGTGNVQMMVGALTPGEIVVEDIGPVPTVLGTLEDIRDDQPKPKGRR
jgi:hypothetical protein